MQQALLLVAGLALATMIGCDKERIGEDPLVTRGRTLFSDPKFSTDGLTTCGTCHPGGHMDNLKWHFPAIHDSTNGVPDSLRTLTLWGVSETGPPYLWDASGKDLRNVTRLYTDTIMGGTASDDEIEALVAYQRSLVFPQNPWLPSGGTLTAQQERGKLVYETTGLCSPCHPLPTGTTGKPKDVGTGGLFKTPGLRNIVSQYPYFHDGRAATLRDVIDFYDADTSGALRAAGFDIRLSEQEKEDLVEFLKTL